MGEDGVEPVVPHAGTWIEIDCLKQLLLFVLSFPTRERGLKCPATKQKRLYLWSFPTRERGLKSYMRKSGLLGYSVVPHAGTWIEINDEDLEWNRAIESFPTRERGLK